MVSPLSAKTQRKPRVPSANHLASQPSPMITRRSNRDSIADASHTPSIAGSQIMAPLRAGKSSDGAGTTFGTRSDFSKVPTFSAGREPIHRAATSPSPGLVIGEANDSFEHEADRVAHLICAGPLNAPISASSPGIRRTPDLSGNSGANAAPPMVHRVLAESGRPLDHDTRAFFEPRFGRSFADVRVHDDAASAAAAKAIGARAFTAGHHIAFADGLYRPGSSSGNRLLAHELTHVVQSNGAHAAGVVRRDIAEGSLATTPAAQIMADPMYFENGIARIEFYAAEMARLIYTDGQQLDLGLVPGQIHAPIEAVDYRTPRSSHAVVNRQGSGQTAGSIDFVPRAREIRAGPGVTVDQVVDATHRVIRFTHHATTGRIVPTEVNSISAPRLCEALRGAEAEYARNTDAIAHGMVRALTILEYALLIYSVFESVAGIAARGAGAAEAGAAATASATRAEAALTRLFIRLLRSGAAETTTVEGVGLGGVRATMRATELFVERDAIVNASRIAGQGRLVNAAFERAAIAAAREAGALTARVAYHTVVNAEWGAYLESLGYSYEVMEGIRAGSLVTKVLTKVFTL